MRYLLTLLLLPVLGFSQVETYDYGYEGMELFVRRADSMTIFNHRHTEARTRSRLALEIRDLWLKGRLKEGPFRLRMDDFEAWGSLVVERKGKLIVVNIVGDGIRWDDGRELRYVPPRKVVITKTR
jgi:hypothetical protein